MLPKKNLRGVAITVATPEQMVEEAGRLIAGRGTASTFVAVNVHTFTEAGRSRSYREALNDAAVSFVDGVPIRWLMQACGLEPPPRVHGADLTNLILDRLPRARHLFYGSTPETLDLLRSYLKRRHPEVQPVGFISPPFRKTASAEAAEMIHRLNSSGADILWVALGAPKQELWAYLNRKELRIPVIACVGAVFEIYAGRFTRAPRWLQALGMEWAWRLAQDPWRLWRRYFATNGRFVAELLRCWLSRPRGLQ